jgi:amidase
MTEPGPVTASTVVPTGTLPPPTPAFDTSVWRVVGNPLLGALPGDSPQSLAGESVAVKDLFWVEGAALGAGIPEFLAESPRGTQSAWAVDALRRAGAAIRGIAQTDQFAYSIAGANPRYGTPPNVLVPNAIPGGSSSGSAAAVALGHASIGLGTDTAGSIRIPASYQGLWGLRSTHGAVSVDGVLPLAPTFDAVGWMTRSPQILRAAAAASLDQAAQIELESPRFAIATNLLFAAEPGVQGAFVEAVDALQRAGSLSSPELVDLGEVAELYQLFRTVQQAEAWRQHGDWITAHPGVLGTDIAGRFTLASRVTEAHEAAARVDLESARTRLDQMLDGRVLLLPSASSTAPALSADATTLEAIRMATLGMTAVAGIGGYPALSVPKLTVNGAPVGLCLVGPRYSDLALLDIAKNFI